MSRLESRYNNNNNNLDKQVGQQGAVQGQHKPPGGELHPLQGDNHQVWWGELDQVHQVFQFFRRKHFQGVYLKQKQKSGAGLPKGGCAWPAEVSRWGTSSPPGRQPSRELDQIHQVFQFFCFKHFQVVCLNQMQFILSGSHKQQIMWNWN